MLGVTRRWRRCSSSRRNGNQYDCRLQIRQGAAGAGEIASVGEDDEVGVSAKLRRAVEHARLSAHEEGADPVRLHRPFVTDKLFWRDPGERR